MGTLIIKRQFRAFSDSFSQIMLKAISNVLIVWVLLLESLEGTLPY